MLNIQRAKIISRSSSTQMWQFLQRAGKRVPPNTVIFCAMNVSLILKINSTRTTKQFVCGCVWCVGKFIAELDVFGCCVGSEKEEEKTKKWRIFEEHYQLIAVISRKNNFLTDFTMPCLADAGINMNEDFSPRLLYFSSVETTTTTSEWKEKEEVGEREIWIWYNLHNRTSAHEILKGQFTYLQQS